MATELLERIIISDEELVEWRERLGKNPELRKELTGNSLYWFFHIYFEEYLSYPTAPMHQELCRYLENWDFKMVEVLGFRECAKSVFGILALPIWEMVAERAKMILLLGDSLDQIKFILS